jgi:hypothetical protein
VFRTRLSYANVAATLALSIALGGTATAAITLPRDSVGSLEISRDAVRAPEIKSDSVRSPEIVSGAVRSSEIRDGGVNVADVSTGAQTALRGQLRLAADDNDSFEHLPTCGTQALDDCADHLVLRLREGSAPGTGLGLGGGSAPQSPSTPVPNPPVIEPDRNWLVQAKLQVSVDKGPNFA